MNAVSLNSRGSESKSLTRVVLSEQVKEHIVEAILKGEFQPGERIIESALARELGVSQAPVREAIRDLVILGFLETEPYKGTSVRSFTTDELWEVYAVRGALESLAARLAAENLTQADGERLEAILEEMIEAGRQQDQEGIARLDNEFHEAILQISGNKLLYQLWKSLEFGQWTIVTYKVTTLDLEYLATRHEELLEALKSGQPERATDAMQHHLEDLGKPPKQLE
ncbi:MAG: GntR family transcriptional regulator [Anaerolineales bacterium]